jgi:two-component system, chemotaxis family, protein-glutamate methylesterase/glutaminase
MSYELIVIGASWGGLHAVGKILSSLPQDTDAAIVVAQHRRSDTPDGGLAGLLSLRSDLPVSDANDKDPIRPRHVYLAPPGYHLLIQRGWFSLSTDDHVQFARPSIDVLFESAADAYGEGVIGVILTGSNQDGAAGLAKIKERGGVAIVQDPQTAERHEMPSSALQATAADAVLPLDEIGPFVYGLVVPPTRQNPEVPA